MPEISIACAAKVSRAIEGLRTDYGALIFAAMNGKNVDAKGEPITLALNRMDRVDGVCRMAVSEAVEDPSSSKVVGADEKKADLGLLKNLKITVASALSSGSPLSPYDAGLVNRQAILNKATDEQLVHLNARAVKNMTPR